jgi:hypothetical protein
VATIDDSGMGPPLNDTGGLDAAGLTSTWTVIPGNSAIGNDGNVVPLPQSKPAAPDLAWYQKLDPRYASGGYYDVAGIPIPAALVDPGIAAAQSLNSMGGQVENAVKGAAAPVAGIQGNMLWIVLAGVAVVVLLAVRR